MPALEDHYIFKVPLFFDSVPHTESRTDLNPALTKHYIIAVVAPAVILTWKCLISFSSFSVALVFYLFIGNMKLRWTRGGGRR